MHLSAQNDVTTQSRKTNIEENIEGLESLIGQKVSFLGEFVAAVGGRSFKSKKRSSLPNSSDSVLVIDTVINQYAITLESMDAAEMLSISGTAEKFEHSKISEKYHLSLDPETHREFEGQLVVIADSVCLRPSLQKVITKPEKFYYQPLTLEGQVKSIFAVDAFSIEDRDSNNKKDLLVIETGFDTGTSEKVSVTGVLEPFSSTDMAISHNLFWGEKH